MVGSTLCSAQTTNWLAENRTTAQGDDFLRKDSVISPLYNDSATNAVHRVEQHFSYKFTKQDLLSSGARDLLEFLNTLPSITIGFNIEGGITVGMRGHDVHENVALVVDGLLMNDGFYEAFQMAGKYNMGQIEKLEIYFGPNPVSFGNISAYGAIVIQTKAFKPFSGVSTEWSQGFTSPNQDARVSSGLSIGKRGALWSVAATTSINRSTISHSSYTDKYNQTYAMETDSWLSNRFTSIKATYKNTSLSLLSDLYQVSTRDADGLSTSQPYVNEYITYGATLRHLEKLSKRTSLFFLGCYKVQDPYKATSEVSAPDSSAFEKVWVRTQRYTGQVHLHHQVREHLNLVVGVQGIYDRASDRLRKEYFEESNYKASYYILSTTAKLQYTKNGTSAFVGLRNETRQHFGNYSSFSASIRQQVKNWYGRVAYSNAYRLPTFANVDLQLPSKPIAPSHVQSVDAEVGWKVKGVTSGLNIFYTKTLNGIVYQALNGQDDIFYNSGPQAVSGTELFVQKSEGRFRFRTGWTMMRNYTNSLGENAFSVNGTTQNLGFATNKWTGTVTGPLYKSLRFSLLAIAEGPKYALESYKSVKLDDKPIVQTPGRTYIRYPSQIFCNAWLHFRIGIANGIDISTGVADIFNTKARYIQFYSSDHLPLPGPSREFLIRISYALVK
jgi:hypothetical protein